MFGKKNRLLSLSAGMLPARTDVQHLLIPIYIRPAPAHPCTSECCDDSAMLIHSILFVLLTVFSPPDAARTENLKKCHQKAFICALNSVHMIHCGLMTGQTRAKRSLIMTKKSGNLYDFRH